MIKAVAKISGDDYNVVVKTYSFVRFSFLCRSKNPEKLMFFEVFKEAQTGFEPVDTGVADHCLTTWLLRLVYYIICRTQSKNDSDGNRTRVTAVKGRCLNRLTTEPLFFSRFLPLAPRFLQRSLTPQDSAFTANSPSRARTYNNSVNSRVLYH